MDSNVQLQRTMSLTDTNTSSAINDAIERDLTVPADRSKHRFFLQLPRHDFILPSLTRFDQDFRKFLLSALVDFDLMQVLEGAKCLNWCPALPKFLPLQTMGDGNCLMHAASLCMWAVQDRRLTLRKSVYQILIEDQSDTFRKRWQLEQEKRLEEQHGSPVDCSSEQWNQDWKKTINLASTTTSPETNTLSSLEEIHVFALSNVLQRPIIVLCDDIHRGNYDESLADVSLGGIYLPLLCDSVDCFKSPIVIGYNQGHFMALVTTEDGNVDMLGRNSVPLVKYDDSEMQIHFLLPEEQQSSDRLLREYLNCSKVQHTKESVTRTILVATMESQEPEAHLDQMFKTYFRALEEVYLAKLAEKELSLSTENYRPQAAHGTPFYGTKYHSTETSVSHNKSPACCNAHKRCKNANCENYTTLPHDYCHTCRKNKTRVCTSPGCNFTAGPGYEGLCSKCFTRFHAILEQDARMVAPSAPPSNRCSVGNCQNEAGHHFHGKCQDCYLKCIHDANFGKITVSVTNSIVEQKSAGAVKNVKHEKQKPSPAMPRQNSRLFCSKQLCNNFLQDSENIYCEECQASAPESRTDLHAINNKPPNPSKTIYEVCRMSGCRLPAVTYHGQLCYKHYRSNNHHAPQQQPKNTKCVTKGCTYFGSPEHNYLCSLCHAQALQEQYDMDRIREEQERAQAEWFSQLATRRSEYCQFDGCTVSRKPFYLESISTPIRSSSAPPSPNPRRKYSNHTIPCVTKGCPSLGFKETEGLCEICFKKREKLLNYQGCSRRSRFPSTP